MELTKEKFCDIINKLLDDYKAAEEIDEVLKKYKYSQRDFFGANCLFDNNIDIVIKLLEVIMNDEEEWINYFIFERHFFYEEVEVFEELKDDNGNVIPFDTAEDLWELLNENH